MEGERGGDDGGGRRRTKKTIRRRPTDEGPSTVAQEDPPAVPMEEDIAAAAPGEDEPIGPKKSELRSRLGWAVVRAIYQGLPDFQRARLERMGFGPFLRLDELVPDVALIQALKERWDPKCHTFLFPLGHMIPTLEDVARITGLRVDGQAVTGVTYTSYQEQAERLLGLEVTRERSSLVRRTGLQASLGVANARHRTGEGQVDYMARLTEDARAALTEEEGETADRDLRRFLILVIGKLILGTRGDPISCRCLPLLEDLYGVDSYAWGAALLAHLFDSLGTSSREMGVAGCGTDCVALQVWAYYHLPSLGRGVLRRPGFVPLLQRWRFCRDEDPYGDSSSCDVQVQWTPYVGEDDAAQPWVERGRPYFGRDIWLHSFNTVVPLHHRLIARSLGLHQAVLEDWEQRGREVTSEATSDEDYFRAYARRYGAQFDPEGRIASLEGVLHSTIQQRDDLQTIVTQLREELNRA
ncbi:hypothetical protein Taro_048613 [Colocasia esculenta]|uniref:Aminotransferase-like plant mobile domain-containing protein n=1 Tax=Colocasia esculenta TaxID=4460 RepID=A0A843X8K7_COLES|nr:hypothetical protein [Colocasia esculenta]